MIVIIQARTGSSRFKNKVLIKVHGKPLIWYVLRQVKKSQKVKKIIIAIPKGQKDRQLYYYLKKNNNCVYRGDENNVAKRILYAAIKYKASNFMRISADSPLIKPSIINKCIKLKDLFFDYDLISNVFPRIFQFENALNVKSGNIREKGRILKIIMLLLGWPKASKRGG